MINAWNLLWIIPLSMAAGAVSLMVVVSKVLDYYEKQEMISYN